jgi:hypothetical protein
MSGCHCCSFHDDDVTECGYVASNYWKTGEQWMKTVWKKVVHSVRTLPAAKLRAFSLFRIIPTILGDLLDSESRRGPLSCIKCRG